jgi:hypothetical protein
VSAVAGLLALVLTPLNFTWMVSTNPATAGWLRTLDIDAVRHLVQPAGAAGRADAGWAAVTRAAAGAGRAHPQAAGQFFAAGAAGLHRAGPGARSASC